MQTCVSHSFHGDKMPTGMTDHDLKSLTQAGSMIPLSTGEYECSFCGMNNIMTLKQSSLSVPKASHKLN
jgi:hypothetical protein